MVDRDYPPLSVNCVRNLQDKLYDKRKSGALEIEKMIKEYMATNNFKEIEAILHILGKNFAVSTNCHVRKGALIGLASLTLALGNISHHYIAPIMNPVIQCLTDSDSRVRYYACEALFNIVKITKDESLLFFNDIFDGLSKCAADPDTSVRKGSSQLDRVMKDMIKESAAFDITAFIPLLRERIGSKSPFSRQFIVSWIATLDNVPDINMTTVLPDILDGLFIILSDTNEEIRQRCEQLLKELLDGITTSPCRVNYPAMVNILIIQCQKFTDSNLETQALVQQTAVNWLHRFLQQAGNEMLPYTSGIIGAVLPCYEYTNAGRKEVMECAVKVNELLISLVEENSCPEVDVVPLDSDRPDPTKNDLNISRTLDVLCRLTLHQCENTRLAALRWIDTLINNRPRQVFIHAQEIFPLLLGILSDASNNVVHWDLQLLCKLSSHPAGLEVKEYVPQELLKLPPSIDNVFPPEINPYLLRFMVDLMKLFDTDHKMLSDRGDLIITDITMNLGAELIFRILSEIVLRVIDANSAFTLVQAFNRILLTQAALHNFRLKLRSLNSEESCFLFCCLYRAWSHSPVSLLSLCLLSRNYKHASRLMRYFGDIEITVDTLTEIDQLIQLIESPIFAYLRLHLLDTRYSGPLQDTLYSLLMCLPQTEAFNLLRRRLHCIPSLPIQERCRLIDEDSIDETFISKHIDFDALLNHFRQIQYDKASAKMKKLSEIRHALPDSVLPTGLASFKSLGLSGDEKGRVEQDSEPSPAGKTLRIPPST